MLKIVNDVTADVAQLKYSKNKYYILTFRYIQVETNILSYFFLRMKVKKTKNDVKLSNH